MEVNGIKTWVVMARYQQFSSCGEKSGIIRVDDFKQACVMQSDGKVGSKGMELRMYGGWMSRPRVTAHLHALIIILEHMLIP